ncbi:BlaI/MecI/CopY family transcriptional regulator [Longicatena caecimuris]|uniref:BlaI/MecI/CopY family transcriptional regulator n=1 Tax=Longicatena caecimuris TaxID=1796635 RepID=UPI00399970E3
MPYNKLTKRESEVMQILWDNDEDMSANDIMMKSSGISMTTTQQLLQKLLKMNFVYVSSIGKNKKAITRLYRPSVSEADYISSFINQNTSMKIASNFIEQTDDDEVLDKLSKLIEEKRKSR